MGWEIEKKFLVRSLEWKTGLTGTPISQGYLNSNKERVVRVRHTPSVSHLTIKGPNQGALRPEFEYEIPAQDALYLLRNLCELPLLEKTRYHVKAGAALWEIDEFAGANQGLVTAEIELESEEQSFERPDWLGLEVTDDARYFNSNLLKNPFKDWN